MRKYASTLLLTSLSLVFVGSAVAGSYTITQGSNGAINDAGTDTGNHVDDGVTGPLALPFAFTLYDQSFNTFSVSSNGVVYFVDGNSATAGTIPDSGFSYAIFPQWFDQCTGSDGQGGCGSNTDFGIFTNTLGSPGSREFDIEFSTFQCCNTDQPTFLYEVQLFENSTSFNVVYSGSISPLGTIGVQKDLNDFTVFQQGSETCDNCTFTSVIGTDAAVSNPVLTFDLAATPEPGTCLMIGFGLLAIPAVRRFARRA